MLQILLKNFHILLPLHCLSLINLNLLQGSAISIVGSSGCGKSTLISVIAGLEKPNKGDVTIQGTNIIPLNENELAKLRVCHGCKKGELGIKAGKFGAFLGCSDYPECSYKKGLFVVQDGTNDGAEIVERQNFKYVSFLSQGISSFVTKSIFFSLK